MLGPSNQLPPQEMGHFENPWQVCTKATNVTPSFFTSWLLTIGETEAGGEELCNQWIMTQAKPWGGGGGQVGGCGRAWSGHSPHLGACCLYNCSLFSLFSFFHKSENPPQISWVMKTGTHVGFCQRARVMRMWEKWGIPVLGFSETTLWSLRSISHFCKKVSLAFLTLIFCQGISVCA